VSYSCTHRLHDAPCAETIHSTRGDLALKIFGPDLETLDSLGHKAAAIVSSVRGASQTQMEQISGAEEVQIHINRPAAARYGVKVSERTRGDLESMYAVAARSPEIVEDDQTISPGSTSSGSGEK